MRGVAAVPAVAPDAALEALSLRDADDVDQLTGREHLDCQRLSELVALELLGLLEPDLADHPHRSHVHLLEQPRRGFRHVLLLRAEPELQGVVAVGVRRPDPDDRAGSGLDNSHLHLTAVVGKHLRHPHLAPDQSLFSRHLSSAFPSSRGRSKPSRCEAPTSDDCGVALLRRREERGGNEADGRFSSAAHSLISTSTPAGRSSFISESTVWGVGSRMSSSRLWVRISNCSRDVLSTCGERSTVHRLMIVGSSTGPTTRAPVRRTVSTISFMERSRRLWSYAFRRMRIFWSALTVT